jgi:hypothetical protein
MVMVAISQRKIDNRLIKPALLTSTIGQQAQATGCKLTGNKAKPMDIGPTDKGLLTCARSAFDVLLLTPQPPSRHQATNLSSASDDCPT